MKHNRVILSFFFAFAVLQFSSCGGGSRSLPVTPPATHPLARQAIAYGVVNVSFTHFLSAPGTGGVSQVHLRQGTVVHIIERRQITHLGNPQSWVFAQTSAEPPAAPFSGWLLESNLQVFDRESRALTASRAIGQ